MAATKYCIRVRPYNVKQKAITRRYTHKGRRFSHDDPWVITADREMAKELSQIKDRHGNPIFEVKTLSAAQEDRRRSENDPTMGDEIDSSVFRESKTSQLGIHETLPPVAKVFEGGEQFQEDDFKARDPYAGMGDVDFSEDKEDIFSEEQEKIGLSKPSAKTASKAKSQRKAAPRKRRSESV